MRSIIACAKIEREIHIIRDHSVMLDSDLAELYGVEVGALIRATKRNIDRFPEDFQFQLTKDEALRCQIGITNNRRGGRRYLPYAFTEQGVAMLSSVLNSKRAIQVNIQIMRAFIRLRGFQFSYAELRKEFQAMRKKYDGSFASVFHTIRQILDGPKKKVQVEGFIRTIKE